MPVRNTVVTFDSVGPRESRRCLDALPARVALTMLFDASMLRQSNDGADAGLPFADRLTARAHRSATRISAALEGTG